LRATTAIEREDFSEPLYLRRRARADRLEFLWRIAEFLAFYRREH
jgi:hypothetical protein